MNKERKFKIQWLVGWMVFHSIAFILALLSTGAGHGDYFFVKVFFPITMYVWFIHWRLPGLMMTLPFIQYPMVGLAPFIFARRRRKYFYALLLAVNLYFLVLVFVRENYKYSTMTGNYVAEYGHSGRINTCCLELKEDGTFSQVTIEPDGNRHTNNGQWQFVWEYGAPRVKTSNLMLLGPIADGPEYFVSRDSTVRPSIFGRRQLWFDKSLVFSYKSALK